MRNAAEREQVINEQKRLIGWKVKIWVRDERREFDVFRVPVEPLVLNVDNRRFRVERLWAEEQLGRSLDPENHPANIYNFWFDLTEADSAVNSNVWITTGNYGGPMLLNKKSVIYLWGNDNPAVLGVGDP